MSKKNKVLPIAVSDEDFVALDEVRQRLLFNPSRSEVARGLFHYALDRVRRRKVSLRLISQMSDIAPIAGDEGKA